MKLSISKQLTIIITDTTINAKINKNIARHIMVYFNSSWVGEKILLSDIVSLDFFLFSISLLNCVITFLTMSSDTVVVVCFVVKGMEVVNICDVEVESVVD